MNWIMRLLLTQYTARVAPVDRHRRFNTHVTQQARDIVSSFLSFIFLCFDDNLALTPRHID
jgi:SepF-like predicted cell division protein (DUF552 family)